MQRVCFQSSVVSLPFPLLQEVLNMFKAEWQAFWNFLHCPDMEN